MKRSSDRVKLTARLAEMSSWVQTHELYELQAPKYQRKYKYKTKTSTFQVNKTRWSVVCEWDGSVETLKWTLCLQLWLALHLNAFPTNPHCNECRIRPVYRVRTAAASLADLSNKNTQTHMGEITASPFTGLWEPRAQTRPRQNLTSENTETESLYHWFL